MEGESSNPEHRMALFQKKGIRRTLHNGEWWFVITDVIAALTDSVNPSDYLKKLRKRDTSLSEFFKGGGQLVPPLGLAFDTPGGLQTLQCWNTEGIFRLIQSIPSPKAEPFKRWLARVAQCLNYMKATGLQTCLLLNLGKTKVEVRRLGMSLGNDSGMTLAETPDGTGTEQ